MALLSNNGRLISSLPPATSIVDADEFLLQSSGITKRVSYSKIKDTVLVSGLNPYTGIVKLLNTSNIFTGSFYANSGLSNFNSVIIRNGLTVTSGNSLFGTIISTGVVYGSFEGGLSGNVNGNVTGNVTGNLTGNVTSTGTSTFANIDVNGGTLDGTAIGASSPSTVIGTTITANTSFVGNLTGNLTGNVTGNLTGDVYNSTSTKVLESGTTAPTSNGGVATAAFYGTSSYATQALTAAYAASSTPASNGLPSGGSQYQVLNKLSGANYDAGWVTPITRSGVPNINYLSYWVDNKTLGGTDLSYNLANNRLSITNGGINITTGNIVMASGNGTITGSIKGYQINRSIESPDDLYTLIEGHKYSAAFLELSASGYCTMSLMTGQTSTVFVQNSGNYKILKWSGSLDGGNSANTKIYWKNAQSASITQGDKKKDIITFVNINDKIFGTVINNFQ